MKAIYHEENVTISGKVNIKGTLTIPQTKQDKFPAVVIVAGSGQVDRDGNPVKMKINMDIYKELAGIISELGFMTLRYDKRGVGQSEGCYIETGMWDLVDDLVSSVDWLKKHPKADDQNIILLGHSEGCTLITAAYEKCRPSGMIMLSGAAEPILDALKRQREIMLNELINAKGLKGKLIKLMKVEEKGETQAQKLIDKVKESKTDTIRYNLVKMNAKWQREHFLYDVYQDLKKIECPILAVTGDKDFQANPERLKDLQGYVKGTAECHVIKNMDHILKEFNGTISAMNYKKQYASEANQPVHEDLIQVIQEWLPLHRCA